MALSKQAIRAIAIRKSIAARASNDNQVQTKMPKGMLAACVDAAGFDQNARFG